MTEKADTIRVKIETTPVIKRALQLRAVIDDIDLQDVVNDALRVYLAEQIAEVISRGMVREEGGEQKPKTTRKRKDTQA